MDVIAVAPTESSERVFDCLQVWSRAGMLQPVIWWRLDRVDQGDKVVLLADGVAKTTRLAGALGEQGTSTSLVGLYAAAAGEIFDPRFVDQLEAARQRLMDTLLFDTAHPLCAYQVFIPGGIGQAIPDSLFKTTTTNIYVAPEDRPCPTGANMLIDYPEMFESHAAHAIVALCELWSTPPDPGLRVLEALRQSYPPNEPYVLVIQCFTRIVEDGYLADDVVGPALKQKGDWPNPAQRRFDRVGDLGPARDYIVDIYMAQHEPFPLGLSPFEPAIYKEQTYSILEALRLFFRFLFERLRTAPVRIVDSAFESLFDNVIGPRVHRLTGYTIKPWRDQETDQLADALGDAVTVPVAVPDGPVAAAWGDLRDVSLSLIDGSNIPTFVNVQACTTNSGHRMVVPDPAVIVPDPRTEMPPPADGDEPPRVCDPQAWDPDLERSTTAEPLPDDVLTPMRASLVWRIGLRIARNLQTARTDGVDPRSLLPPPEQEAVERAMVLAEERRIRRKFLRNALLGTVVAAAAGWLEITHLRFLWAAVAVPLTGILWLWGLMKIGSATQKRVLAGRKRYQEHRVECLNRVLLAMLRKTDKDRLERRYREYLDWAEIIGWVAHRPWTPVDLRQEPRPDADELSKLPSSITVGHCAVAQDRLEELRADGAGIVFQPGWLAGVYEYMVNRSGTDYLRLKVHSTDRQDAGGGIPDPTEDTSLDSDSVRAFFLRGLRGSVYPQEMATEIVDRVVGYLDRLTVAQLYGASDVVYRDPKDPTPKSAPSPAGDPPGQGDQVEPHSLAELFDALQINQGDPVFLPDHWREASADQTHVALPLGGEVIASIEAQPIYCRLGSVTRTIATIVVSAKPALAEGLAGLTPDVPLVS